MRTGARVRAVGGGVAWAALVVVLVAGAGSAACNGIIGLEEPTVRDAGAEDGAAPPPGADASGARDAGTDSDADALSGDSGLAQPRDAAPVPEVGSAPDSGCTSTPVLRPGLPGTIPCQLGADGGPLVCGVGTQCCDGAMIGPGTFAANDCEPFGTTCVNGGAGGLVLECNQVADCTINDAGANACCLVGASSPAIVPACGYYKATGGSGVHCEQAAGGLCGIGEINVCSSDVDCPTGHTCAPLDWKIFQFGFCQ